MCPERLLGADNLEVLVDEDVVGPVDADVVDLVLAVAELHHTVDDSAGVDAAPFWKGITFAAVEAAGPPLSTMTWVALMVVELTVPSTRTWSLLLLVCYAESDSRSFEFPAGNLLVSRQFRPPTP
jgi:hypothetical protein